MGDGRGPLAVGSVVVLTGSAIAVAGTLAAGKQVRVPDDPLAGSPACAQSVARATAAGSLNYPDAEVAARGMTWQTPVVARLDASTTVLNDKETITADPVGAQTAYAVWDRLVSLSQNANPGAFNVSAAFRGPVMLSKTTDGGLNWSQGRAIFDPGEKNQTIGNQIVVPTTGPSAGMLIDGFDRSSRRAARATTSAPPTTSR